MNRRAMVDFNIDFVEDLRQFIWSGSAKFDKEREFQILFMQSKQIDSKWIVVGSSQLIAIKKHFQYNPGKVVENK